VEYPPFVNEPLSDFSDLARRAAFARTLARVDAELGPAWSRPMWIGGEKVDTGAWLESHDPTTPSRVVGRVATATPELADAAVVAAAKAFTTWSQVPVAERAALVAKVSAIIRDRRDEFSATMVVEAGKTWGEADADAAEAVDFGELYLRDAIRLSGPQPVAHRPGTRNRFVYTPMGVGVIIPPWNFPLAITVGMTMSAVVTGNVAIVKPSSLTPLIAAKFIDACIEAGIPDGVVNFLPGAGETVGMRLVEHPGVRFISFTGSRAVGEQIYARAAVVQPGQRWLKRVVSEMGGKNAIVVDETADLDAAAQAVAASAFGFGGQKCSACSRLVAVDAIHDDLLARVEVEVRKIRIGDPRDADTDLGPLSSAAQKRTAARYVAIGHGEGTVVVGPDTLVPADGHYVAPHVVAGVASRSRLGQEEIFGPVLAVLRARDFDDALAVANDTEYGLTGAVFSQDRARLDRAAAEFACGNLYFNRKCTGAFVGVEPFGGFNMSGTDSKAGGHDHLLLFVQGKSISEPVN
jgi:1-pyrroline-5-carboxylate dehydrogenase